MKLRTFTILVMASLAAWSSTNIAAGEKPNILYIMSDDHAFQAISAYGHPVSKLAPTPNIDRLADQGMRFDRAFVTNSLCGPSRAAMMTGQFGHINGFSYNGQVFNNRQTTWPRTLKDAGYQTAMIGKWHLSKTPEGIGFDHWQTLRDQGEYYNPDFLSPDGVETVEGYVTDLITEFALKWLDSGRDKDKPFALLLHHKAPHRNWSPALKNANMFDDTVFPVPDNYFDDYENRLAAEQQKMNIYRDMYEGHDLKMTVEAGSTEYRFDPWPHLLERMTEEQRKAWDAAYKKRNEEMHAANFSEKELALWKYQRYMQDYLATIASVDEGVGEVLDYLDENGLTENTIVIYTSDQGFYLGEHGWFDKRFMYEESLRTPLLIRYPEHIEAGSVSSEFVQNIDFMPTFLDWAGVEIPAGVQGESIRGIAEGDVPSDWRTSVYYHFYEFPGFHSVKRHYGVRDQRFKLIHFYNNIDEWEFYDLDKDPSEMTNLIEAPEYQDEIGRLRTELARLQAYYQEPPIEQWKDQKLERKRRKKK